MQKYYYQQGRCESNRYLSLNPILYESTEEKDIYRKTRMVCRLVNEGACDRITACPLFEAAPEFVTDDGVSLRDKKLDE